MLSAGSWGLPKSGVALPAINRPPWVLLVIRFRRNTGLASRDRAIAVPLAESWLLATKGAARSLMAMPKALF